MHSYQNIAKESNTNKQNEKVCILANEGANNFE